MNTLTDDCPMPFGKYKGVKMQDVPCEYLHWFWNANPNKPSGISGEVWQYIEDNIDGLKMENKDLIWE